MSSKRSILIEAALVVGVLVAGISATSVAHAAQGTKAPAANAAADARANVKIESKILVERTVKDAAGGDVVTLHDPAKVKVVPGDKLVFINTYKNTAPTAVSGFVVNNAIHPAVNFSEVSEDWALVSVDGGKTFGKLDQLMVKNTPAEGTDPAEASAEPENRAATPVDVTQIRWTFAEPIAPGASGELRFRGVVK